MKAVKIVAAACGVMMATLVFAQANGNYNQPNYTGNPVVPQGTIGATGNSNFSGTQQPATPQGGMGATGYTGATGFTPNTTMPGTTPGTVPGTTSPSGSTGFTGYTGGPPR